MYAVNVESTDALLAEVARALEKADELCSVVDPEETPFRSKYLARAELDAVLGKMEATRTVASLERREAVAADMGVRIAAAKVRLGGLCVEVEEPASAQTELDSALEFYMPGLLARVAQASGELGAEQEQGAAAVDAECVLPDALPAPPLMLDAMRCLNLLGILWAAREHHRRAFAFLFAARELHARGAPCAPPADKPALESLATHNLFYLAQAYGNMGDAEQSCRFCKETLERQLRAGFPSPAARLEWGKNCQGISDFYLARGDYGRSLLALLSSQKVLLEGQQEALSADEAELREEVSMDLERRLVKYDLAVLREAYERRRDGEEPPPPAPCEELLFADLPVAPPALRLPQQIRDFEDARALFLRAAARIEACKKHFLMDGWVTAHVALLQDHSKLYLYLSGFEEDPKRRQAMHARRVDMLRPLLQALSRSAFEGEHKRLSFEVGEAYMALFELRAARLRERGKGRGSAAEVAKCNECSRGAVAGFAHFALLYARTWALEGSVFDKDDDALLALLAVEPDDANISAEEIRPYLNAHLYCCRMLAKVVPSSSEPSDRARHVIASLRRYEWLARRAPRLCESKAADLQSLFGDELAICAEMVELLPAKIDRILYRGEDPLEM